MSIKNIKESAQFAGARRKKIMELYEWQKKIVNHEGNITIRGGRQDGKSWGVAHRIKHLMLKYPGSTSLITSPSERQENYLYDKVKSLFGERDWKKKPILKRLWHRNGSICWKFPIGRTGVLVEGLSSVDFLHVDEAMHMPLRSWNALMPMLLEPRKRGLGWITLLGNTNGKPHGLFYESFQRDDFEKVHIPSWTVPHVDMAFLESERKRLGDVRYSMIYGGEFVDTDYKYYPVKLIDRALSIVEWKLSQYSNRYYCGIDPARFGRDFAAISVAEMDRHGMVKIVYCELIQKCSLVELMARIEWCDKHFNFHKFFVDGMGLGGGLVDFMVEKFRFKVVELDNSARGGESGFLKEKLYENLLRLMELDRIKIINMPEIRQSLLNVEFDGEKFYGENSDAVESIVRAAWCVKAAGYRPKFV